MKGIVAGIIETQTKVLGRNVINDMGRKKMQSVLSYGEFVTYIQENVEAVLNDDREKEVVLTEVEKNNGVISQVMTIQQEGEDSAPVFYMRDIYERYLRGTSADDLIDGMIAACRQHAENGWPVQEGWFDSFENVREHIILKAVNYERNSRQLENCPFIRELDLALTFRVLIEKEQFRIGTILVNDELMRRWGATDFDLYEAAVENMCRLWKSVLAPIHDMVRELGDEYLVNEYDDFLADNPGALEMPMYVLTNEIRINGAAVLFYTDCLKQFASSMQCDVFVLPSSIHEVLLIPVTGEMTALDMRQVVEMVNHQIVSEEEVLSNHVYRYLYKRNKLIIAA